MISYVYIIYLEQPLKHSKKLDKIEFKKYVQVIHRKAGERHKKLK